MYIPIVFPVVGECKDELDIVLCCLLHDIIHTTQASAIIVIDSHAVGALVPFLEPDIIGTRVEKPSAHHWKFCSTSLLEKICDVRLGAIHQIIYVAWIKKLFLLVEHDALKLTCIGAFKVEFRTTQCKTSPISGYKGILSQGGCYQKSGSENRKDCLCQHDWKRMDWVGLVVWTSGIVDVPDIYMYVGYDGSTNVTHCVIHVHGCLANSFSW